MSRALFLLYVVAHACACLQNACLARHSCQHPFRAHLRDDLPVCDVRLPAHVSTVCAVHAEAAQGSRRARQGPGRRRAPVSGRGQAGGADTELREPPACSSRRGIPRCPCGGCFCLRGRPGCPRMGDPAGGGKPRIPAETPAPPPAPGSLPPGFWARALRALCRQAPRPRSQSRRSVFPDPHSAEGAVSG